MEAINCKHTITFSSINAMNLHSHSFNVSDVGQSWCEYWKKKKNKKTLQKTTNFIYFSVVSFRFLTMREAQVLSKTSKQIRKESQYFSLKLK